MINEKTLLNKRLYHTIRDPKKNMSNNEQQPPENAQQEPVSTTNAILTEKEALEMQSQQHAQNPNMPPPPNQNQQSLSAQETQPSETVSPDSRSNTQENVQQSSNVVPFPQPEPPIVNNNNQQAQQPIQATTSAGVTAPPPKPDFTDTDASIQGLLLQVVALQHNKIQQLKQQ